MGESGLCQKARERNRVALRRRKQEAGKGIGFLERTMGLLLSDASDALSGDPPYVNVATHRIQMAQQAIQRELERLGKIQGE